MKNKINQLARGVFEDNAPNMKIGEMAVHEVISADDVYTGELRIFSANNRNIRGIVYSDNPYVNVVNCNFAAADNLVAYKVDTKGMQPQQIIKGNFFVVSDAGERSIPFEFKLNDKTVTTDLGKLKNMFHFANYVQTDYEKALKLFTSPKFKEIFIKDDIEMANLYDSLAKGSDIKTNVEEFLVSIHKKTRVSLSLESTERIFANLSENIEEKIIITKDNWGYVKASVKADAGFIKLSANNIDTDGFVGNSYELSYLIDIEALHAGKNFGNIVISTDNQILVYKVTVVNGTFSEKESHLLSKRAKVKLVQAYIGFRTKKLNVNAWIEESQRQIEIIRGIDDSDCFIKLFQAHLFIADKKETQAKWLIDNVKDEVLLSKDKNMPLYCYYLYVTSLYNKDRLYAIKVMEQIREIYEAGNDDWRILWVLLYLDDENDKNKSLKLIRLKEHFYKGCNSPIMYLEAAGILEEMPMLFRVLDEFEIQVIGFACSHGMISKKTADYVGHMVKNEKKMKRPLINILMKLYREYESDEVLLTLCEALIRNNCVGKQYFEWYKLAVNKEFRITKLYEYYVSCIDMSGMETLPKQILLYFMYNSDVDYKVRAYVYANVTYNRITNPAMFDNYKKDIVDFALAQLKHGHINDNLALIYSNVLTKEMINEGNITYLPKILFTYKVVCNAPYITNVIVRHKESSMENIYPVNSGVAYVQMYTKDARIILETTDKRRYVQNTMYTITRLLDEEPYMENLKGLCEDNIFVALYFTQRYMQRHSVNFEINSVYMSVLKDKTVTNLYKQSIAKVLVDYFYESFETDEGFNSFMKMIGEVCISKEYGSKIIEIFVSRGEYMRAYEYICDHNVYPENAKRIYRLTTKLIELIEKPDDVVLGRLCKMCFKNRKYDENIMNYLLKNYNADIESMFELWEMMGNFMMERYELSERIIAQALFTGEYNKNIFEVFADYYNHGANERIVEAYISYNCYNYFVKEMLIEEDILKIVEHRIFRGMEALEVCELALLLYYAHNKELEDKQLKLAGEIMEKFVRRDMHFAFYKEFLGRISLPYCVVDKTYVEYRTDKRAKVIIHYIYEDEEGQKNYKVEDMENVYEGIFVKPFTLFYGKAVQYYITETLDNVSNVTESKRVVNETINPNQTDGRFEAINDILASYELKDMATMKKLIHSYQVKDYVTNSMFTPF